MKKLSILAVFILLSACGSSDKPHQAQPMPNPPAPPPMSMVDAFFSQVMKLIATAEDAEPVAVEGYAATMPENTEPGPVSP